MLPVAHIFGIPVEETISSLAPLLGTVGIAAAALARRILRHHRQQAPADHEDRTGNAEGV